MGQKRKNTYAGPIGFREKRRLPDGNVCLIREDNGHNEYLHRLVLNLGRYVGRASTAIVWLIRKEINFANIIKYILVIHIVLYTDRLYPLTKKKWEEKFL